MGKLFASLFFLVFLLMGCYFFVLGIYQLGSTTLACERVESTQINCNITEHRWLGMGTSTTLLTHVEQARSEGYKCGTSKKRQSCHRLVIKTKNGEVRLKYPSEDLVADINRFLTSKQSTLTLKEGNYIGLLPMVFGGVAMFIFGSLTVISSKEIFTQTSATKPQ